MTSTDSIIKKISNAENIEIISEQYKRYGERYLTYRKQYFQSIDELDISNPLYVHFEQTYRCNLKCPSCLQGYPEYKKKFNTSTALMPIDLYKKVIKDCGEINCPSIALHNIDEPLLVPNIDDRIRLAVRNNIMDIIMTTNGQLLTSELANRICNAGLTHILFSIDAASPETYAIVRPGGNFNKVLKAIEYINNWKVQNKCSLPIIRASFVLSKFNYFEENKFIERFKKIVDYIDIQSFYSVFDLNQNMIPDHFKSINPGSFVCQEPFRKIIVRANGDVLPCCSIYGYQQVLGNVKNDSITNIYTNNHGQTLRNQIKEKKYNQICLKCISNMYERI